MHVCLQGLLLQPQSATGLFGLYASVVFLLRQLRLFLKMHKVHKNTIRISLQKHSVMRPVKLAYMSDLFSRRYAYRQQLGTLYRTTYYSQRHCCTGYRSCNCQSCGLACISCSSGCCRKLKRCLAVSTKFITVVAIQLYLPIL